MNPLSCCSLTSSVPAPYAFPPSLTDRHGKDVQVPLDTTLLYRLLDKEPTCLPHVEEPSPGIALQPHKITYFLAT